MYQAPLDDMRFVLSNIANLPQIRDLPGYEEASDDLVDAILTEGAKFAEEIIAPLNHTGDQNGATYENGAVTTPPGYKEAYAAFVEAGWQSVPFSPEHGGQGLPWVLQTALAEMVHAGCLAFGLAPLLTQGAIDAIEEHGSPEQQALYLPKLITGEWNGTMNLTEPHAGTDVGAVKSRAIPQDDGTYRIKGQKIFITWGENDCSSNIVHLVLARLPDAPQGTKGISLFIVPKFLPDADGQPGGRNDLRCSGIEEKLGIHGSPTAIMSFGDNEGATGWLIGEPHHGMTYMFTMMNNARLAVGLEGLALSERAWQHALAYAKDRIQGSDPATRQPVAIIQHPDVRRNLMLMKSTIAAMRALTYYALAQQDVARKSTDAEAAKAAQAEVDVLTPIVKSWNTDNAVTLASIGVQIHGGMGFIEETGAAQHYRDARILPIYEGTNGVQALDLMGRKTKRDGGLAVSALFAKMRADADAADAALAEPFLSVLGLLEEAKDWIIAADFPDAASGATAYQSLFSVTAGGWMMLKRVAATEGQGESFAAHQRQLATFYMGNVLSQAYGFAAAMRQSGTVNDIDVDAL